MSDAAPSVEKLEKQLRMLKKKLERSEWHRVDLENQHDRDQHLYRRLQADLEAARREAEVEAALERVRSRTMAMHASDELREVVAVTYAELQALGFPSAACILITRDEARGGWEFWMSNRRREVLPEPYLIPPFDHPVYRQIRDGWESGVPYQEVEMDAETSRSYTEALFAHTELARLPEPVKAAMHVGRGTVLCEAFTPHCILEAVGKEPLTDSEAALLQRFARVFDQAYTRYLDLQRAEARAREAEIEAALEKVRSSSLAVTSTDEFGEVVTVVFEKLSELGIPAYSVTMPLLREDTDAWDVYGCGVSDEGLTTLNFKLPYFSNPITDDILDAKRTSVSGYISTVYSPEEKDRYYDYALTQTELRNLPDDVKETIRQRTPYAVCAAYAKSSVIIANDFEGNELTEAQAEILKRFSKVFDQAYTRFLDLQRAEEQAREAEIEAALERLRSRTMGMQSSDELGAISHELVKQVQALGVDTWHCAFHVYDEGAESSTEWGANADGYYPAYTIPRVGVFRRYREIGRSGADLHVEEIGEDRCARHYEELCAVPGVGEVLLELKASGVPFPERQVDHVAFFKYGYLIFVTYEPAPEAHDVFRRFATVFEQTYTRFLDLQQAEARSREARIEAAMERVRSRALAMTTSDELLDVIFEIRRQFAGLDLECGAFWHTRYTPEVYQKALTSIDGKQLAAVMELPRDFASNPDLAAWEHGDEPVGVFVFDAEAGAAYMHHMATKGKFSEIDPEAVTVEMVREHGGITFVQARTSHGEIGYSLWGEAEPTEEAKDVLVRFATAFDLAYRRFEDLQQAERDHEALLEEKALTERALDELRATQAQLVQKEKMASLGQLTAGIAHEIKNPLNFVNNFAALSRELLDELADVVGEAERDEILGDLRQNAEKIEEHGRRADGIVKSMMAHARSRSGPHRPVALNPLVEEHVGHALHAMRVRHPEFDLSLEVRLADDVGEVVMEPQEIGRVLVNLVDNALDAARQRAEAELNGYAPSVTVSTRATGTGVEVRVEDNGTGMPEAVRAKVFEPFFTTKPTGQGTGLGLSLSHDIVAQGHGGALTVESEEGRGTVFALTLPTEPLEAAPRAGA